MDFSTLMSQAGPTAGKIGGMSGMQRAGGALSGFGQGMTTMDPAVNKAYQAGSGGYSDMAHAERIKEILGGHNAPDQDLEQATQDWHSGPKPTSVAPKDIRGGRGTAPTGFDYNSIMKGAN